MRYGRSKEYLKGTQHGRGAFRFPTERFLFSRLGRPWDAVHSELSQEFDRRTYVGYMFWRNFDREVATICWVGAKTGAIFEYTSWGDGRVDGFYVHPYTGLLSYQKFISREKSPAKPATHIVIDNKNSIDKMDGIWYYTLYKKVETHYYTGAPVLQLDGTYVYTVPAPYEVEYKKKQLSSKELKAHGLVNDTPEQIREAKADAEKLAKMQREALRYIHGDQHA